MTRTDSLPRAAGALLTMAAALTAWTSLGCVGQLDLLSDLVGGESETEGIAVIPTDPENYCSVNLNWNADWIGFENEVLVLVNQQRAQGATCGGEGTFSPTAPVTMNSELRCAARNHALDMSLRDFFDHVNPDGLRAGDRIELTGYRWWAWGENIAWGQTSAARVVSSWMNSPGHCANIMNPDFSETGVGYYSGNYWTLTFGHPAD